MSELLKDDEIAELRALDREAARAPWKALPGLSPFECGGIEDANGNDVVKTDSGFYPPRATTAQLIVRARNLLPRLLDEREALRAEIEQEKAMFRLLQQRLERTEAELRAATAANAPR